MAEVRIPRHVGLIMDGNGRWAKKRLRPRSFGHNAGVNTMIEIARHAEKLGIACLTVYALSTENLSNRPQDELEGLFDLLRKYFSKKVKNLRSDGTAVRIIGDISALPADVVELLKDCQNNSPTEPSFTLVFAINYGARAEIVRAAKEVKESGEEINEHSLERRMYTYGLPELDLVIRTGGECRLSNFLLWQAAYAELYFTPVLFPDFTCEEFDKAIEEYSKRNRRFGGV